MLKICMTRIPEATRELSHPELLYRLSMALMGAQMAKPKDKAACRRLQKWIKELEAEEKEEEPNAPSDVF